MTMRFDSLAAFATHLIESEIVISERLHHGLERCAALIQNRAEAKIGHYQEAAGPFPEWPALADSTEDRKAALGYPADSPLLAAGDLAESFGRDVGVTEALIGSTDQNMVYSEFGTSRMPARPVLGPAAFESKEAIERILGEAVVEGLIGRELIHPALGYDMAVKG